MTATTTTIQACINLQHTAIQGNPVASYKVVRRDKRGQKVGDPVKGRYKANSGSQESPYMYDVRFSQPVGANTDWTVAVTMEWEGWPFLRWFKKVWVAFSKYRPKDGMGGSEDVVDSELVTSGEQVSVRVRYLSPQDNLNNAYLAVIANSGQPR
ncbi:hypothetical protein MVEN_00439900 [Mycena venus]|uniref:Uncharacterized protein n=1 Tax=Mycena venus TaxID=2733690 RepID=A0A8H6YSU2_9AGAR|nr:hypothetical protein MVEN_00439900 [Mycena venus]